MQSKPIRRRGHIFAKNRRTRAASIPNLRARQMHSARAARSRLARPAGASIANAESPVESSAVLK